MSIRIRVSISIEVSIRVPIRANIRHGRIRRRVMRWMLLRLLMMLIMMMMTPRPRNKQRPPIMRTPFLTPEMRRGREGLGETLVRSAGVEDLRTPGFAFVHYAGVFEFLDEGFFASEDA